MSKKCLLSFQKCKNLLTNCTRETVYFQGANDDVQASAVTTNFWCFNDIFCGKESPIIKWDVKVTKYHFGVVNRFESFKSENKTFDVQWHISW